MGTETTTGVTGIVRTQFVLTSERNAPAPRSGNFLAEHSTIAVSTDLAQHERIIVDHNILNGEPYIRGTRIPISAILDGLEEGLTFEELVEHYPRLTPEGFRSVLEYASTLALRPQE